LTAQKGQARSKLATYHLTTPLERLIGGSDLWGKLDSFLNLAEAADRSAHTITTYRCLLGDFVKFVNSRGATLPADVSEEHVVAYIIHKKQTCGGVSVNTYFKHIRAWFNWMVKRGILESSPCASLKAPTIPKTVIRPIVGEQLQKMVACCTDHIYGVRDKAIMLLIYDSGLRRSEVANIKLENVDLDRGAIKVMGKGAKERYVGIGKEVKDALLQYLYMRKDDLPWLFVTCHKENPGKLPPNTIYQAIKHAMKRAGITGVKLGPHALRHGFATASIRNGANLFYVQSLLGHSTLTMTRKYADTINSEEAVKQHHGFSPVDKLRK